MAWESGLNWVTTDNLSQTRHLQLSSVVKGAEFVDQPRLAASALYKCAYSAFLQLARRGAKRVT